jgi:hypothetical protein
MLKKSFILSLVAIFALMNSLLLAQPEESSSEEEEFQWVWGEVTSIDTAKKSITVKYLDYETDTEKEMSLIVDENTKFESAKSLADIKVADTVDIEYIVKDGKNIARNISLDVNDVDASTEATSQKDYKQDQP